jgi:hypothetical protein
MVPFSCDAELNEESLVSLGDRLTGEDHKHLAGIPSFDPKRPVVWFHTDYRFVDQDFAGEAWFWLRGVELPTGRSMCDQRLKPIIGSEDGLRPLIGTDGSRIVIRYNIPNRRGETLEILAIQDVDGKLETTPVAKNLQIPGRLCDISNDGSRLLSVTSGMTIVYTVSAATVKLDGSVSPEDEVNFHSEHLSTTSPDGKLAVSASAEGNIKVYKRDSKEVLTQIESEYIPGEGGRVIRNVEFGPDSRFLLVWGYSVGGGVWDSEVYDAVSGRLVFPRFGGSSDISGGIRRFLPDGKSVELENKQRLRLLPPSSNPPLWFIDMAEQVCGGYISKTGIYTVLGGAERPVLHPSDLIPKARDISGDEEWLTLASGRFGLFR